MAKSYTIFFALLFCFVLITCTGVTKACAPAAAPIESGKVGEETLCQKESVTWSGQCIVTGNCDDQCRNLESAVYGACHWNGLAGFACYCYFNC